MNKADGDFACRIGCRHVHGKGLFSMRKKYVLTLLVAAVGCLYIGWTFYSRWTAKSALIQNLEESSESQKRAVGEAYGDGRVSILNFYAVPPEIRRGESAQLCYGVVNADSVRMEPPVKNIWPSRSRCVEVAPESDTVYTLAAEDAAGNKVTAETAVLVR